MAHTDRDRRQTRLSFASLIVSILALINAITGPFIAFYWLQGTLRLYELKRSAFSAEGVVGTEDCPGFPKGVIYYVEIRNSGSLPIEKVRVSVQRRFRRVRGDMKVVQPDPKIVEVFPPVSLEIEKHDRGVLVTFKDAIPPHNETRLTVAEYTVLDKKAPVESMAPSVWVFSEVSGEQVSWSEAAIWEHDCP
jgi:hypothetical protein